jgi:hypothetical protein
MTELSGYAKKLEVPAGFDAPGMVRYDGYSSAARARAA